MTLSLGSLPSGRRFGALSDGAVSDREGFLAALCFRQSWWPRRTSPTWLGIEIEQSTQRFRDFRLATEGPDRIDEAGT